MKQLPANSLALIDELDKLFPQRVLREGETHDEHLRYAGKCDLIQFLKRLRDDTHASRPTDKIIR